MTDYHQPSEPEASIEVYLLFVDKIVGLTQASYPKPSTGSRTGQDGHEAVQLKVKSNTPNGV